VVRFCGLSGDRIFVEWQSSIVASNISALRKSMSKR
jgi:hypothetical protein